MQTASERFVGMRPSEAAPDESAMGRLFSKLKSLARRAKRDGIALYLAARDPRVPPGVKLFAFIVAAYALSPIDLIPDFIPVLGYLDELILLPAAVAVMVLWIEPAVMAEHRREAERLADRPVSKAGAAIVGLVWIAAAALIIGAVL